MVGAMLAEAFVVSVDSLLDAHEVAMRARVDALGVEAARVAAELGEAQRALEHVAITRATLGALVAADALADQQPDGVAVCAAEPSHVPVWRDGMGESHLPAGYRQVWQAVIGAGGAVRAKQFAGLLGLETSPAKVEGLRSKLKRLAARGWLVETGGVFAAATAFASPDGGS